MKSKRQFIGFILLFLIGAGILFYPTISFWLAEQNHVVAHQSYERNVANLNKTEKQEFWNVAVYYNERLANSIIKDPFANTEFVDPFDEYYQTLDIEGGIMGYIEIPSIDAFLPIYHGVSDEVLEKGVGHIPATALPVGGDGTHSVLTGHTGLNHAKMFNDLVKVKHGEEFYLEILDEKLAYQVSKIEVVLPDDVSSLQREDGEDKVTLVTCTPYGVNSHRLLVTGERIPYIEGSAEQIRAANKASFPWWIVIVIVSVITVITIIGNQMKKRVKKRVKQNNEKKFNTTPSGKKVPII